MVSRPKSNLGHIGGRGGRGRGCSNHCANPTPVNRYLRLFPLFLTNEVWCGSERWSGSHINVFFFIIHIFPTLSLATNQIKNISNWKQIDSCNKTSHSISSAGETFWKESVMRRLQTPQWKILWSDRFMFHTGEGKPCSRGFPPQTGMKRGETWGQD